MGFKSQKQSAAHSKLDDQGKRKQACSRKTLKLLNTFNKVEYKINTKYVAQGSGQTQE